MKKILFEFVLNLSKAIILLVVLFSLFGWFFFGEGGSMVDNMFFRAGMIRSVFSGEQLALLPKTVRDLKISESRTIFSLSYRGSFSADAAVMEDWLKNSPGIAGDHPEKQNDQSIRYPVEKVSHKFKPLQGLKGEVIISPDRTHATFRMGMYGLD